MVDELTKIIAKNTSDIQDLQVGESTGYELKYVDLSESLSGTDSLTAKKRIVGIEFILDKSKVVGSGIGSSYDRIRGMGLDVPKETYDAGLLGLYRFDEATTATTLDSSANANNAVAISGTTVVNGKYNFSNARDFNGTSDMINLGNPASLNLANGSNLTIEAWLNPAGSANKSLLSKGAIGARTLDLSINATNQKCAFYLTTNVGNVNIFAPGSLIIGEWAHLGFTYDATYMRIYLNNSCVASGAQTGSVINTGSNWVIGNFSDGAAPYFYKGRLDDIAIYNYAKTDFTNSYQPKNGSGWEVVTL